MRDNVFAPIELYNLRDDPQETTDLANKEKSTFRNLSLALRRQGPAWRERSVATSGEMRGCGLIAILSIPPMIPAKLAKFATSLIVFALVCVASGADSAAKRPNIVFISRTITPTRRSAPMAIPGI
ncbi:MAG: hypothetical protein WDN28_20935 [Chthoniobacter sp.]